MKSIQLQHIAFAITLNCALKCKLCSILSPCVGFIDGVLVACPGTYVRYVCSEIDRDHEEIIDLF